MAETAFPETGLEFGVFDWIESSSAAPAEIFEHKLQIAEAADAAGFRGWHLAEHQGTPLSIDGAPSLMIAAAAQRTRRLRLGALTWCLPWYNPYRFYCEICMLDHMSGGRFQLGVGRGISPFELGYYGVDAKQSQAMYHEAYSVILKAFAADTLTYEGKHYAFRDVPIMMHPLQKPHPPLWYGVGHVDGVAWCVQNKVNAVVNGPLARVREITDRYRAEWAKAGQDPARMPDVGTTRHLVIAPTDAEALASARRAYARWWSSFMFLWKKHDAAPAFSAFPEDFDAVFRAGLVAAGSPSTVRGMLAAEIEKSGANYLLLRFAFGDLSLEESMQSVDLFAAEVMPHLR